MSEIVESEERKATAAQNTEGSGEDVLLNQTGFMKHMKLSKNIQLGTSSDISFAIMT